MLAASEAHLRAAVHDALETDGRRRKVAEFDNYSVDYWGELDWQPCRP
jgi:hypothetical protein